MVGPGDLSPGSRAHHVRAEDVPEGAAVRVENLQPGDEVEVGRGCACAKLAVVSCRGAVVRVATGAKLFAEGVEVWDCADLELRVERAVGNLQIDNCPGAVTVAFKKAEYLGYAVQCNVEGLRLRFADTPDLDAEVGFSAMAAEHADAVRETDQFIHRVIGGRLYSEMVLRRADGYMTTEREEKKEDEKRYREGAQARDLLHHGGQAGKLTDGDVERLEEKLAVVERRAGSSAKAVTAAERAAHLKAKGNELFKGGEYTQAAVSYTEALMLDTSMHACLSNRAASFLQTGHYDKALLDAEACLELEPDFVKAHFRKGLALAALERHGEAGSAFTRALELDPKNKQIESALRMAQMKLQRSLRPRRPDEED